MTRITAPLTLFLIAFGWSSMAVVSAFVGPTTTTSQNSIARTQSEATATFVRHSLHKRRGLHPQHHLHARRLHDTRLFNKVLDFFSPYESKIPEELRDEIYQAEANTAAAQDRGTRVAIYVSLALFGIALASFNGFLTDMRDKESAVAVATAATSIPDTGNNLYILEQNGFGWVLSNPVFKFLFTNKIGGVLSLLFGGGSGILAEAEMDTKRINAEKIYEELERRREQKLKKQNRSAGRNKSRKKRRPGKEKKRLAAISEVMMEDVTETTTETATPSSPSVGISVMPHDEVESADSAANDESPRTVESEGDDQNGIFGKMKELYEKADSMAASQALIMNKNLEDAGVIDKITDETGLKVIGREEAKKVEEQKGIDEKK